MLYHNHAQSLAGSHIERLTLKETQKINTNTNLCSLSFEKLPGFCQGNHSLAYGK